MARSYDNSRLICYKLRDMFYTKRCRARMLYVYTINHQCRRAPYNARSSRPNVLHTTCPPYSYMPPRLNPYPYPPPDALRSTSAMSDT